jgi:hypothetical protein
MLRQKLVFIKTISNNCPFPEFLRELRKVVAAGKKALAATKASATIASRLERPSGVDNEAPTSRDTAAPREQEESQRAFQLRLPV